MPAIVAPTAAPADRPSLPQEAPFISVIVPVRNEAAFIGHTLGQLVSQDYDSDRFEVLVADGRSTDVTRAMVCEMARHHPQVRLLDNPKRWSSAGRNVGVRAARGDIVVVIDGHCEIDNPRYLWELADAFARSGAACIGRPQPLDVSQATLFQQAVALARSSPLGHQPASFIYSALERFVPPQSVAVAYRREVFAQVGLFDESFDACEDVEFNHRVGRAGLTCFFTPKVQVSYQPRDTLPGLFKQMVRYGRGRARLLCRHPDTFSLPCLLPAAFVLGIFAGLIAAWLSPMLATAYWSILALYAVVVLLTGTWLSMRARKLWLLPWLPLVFVTIHLGAGAGILREFLSWFPSPPLRGRGVRGEGGARTAP